jgi:hypothetical protein
MLKFSWIWCKPDAFMVELGRVLCRPNALMVELDMG